MITTVVNVGDTLSPHQVLDFRLQHHRRQVSSDGAQVPQEVMLRNEHMLLLSLSVPVKPHKHNLHFEACWQAAEGALPFVDLRAKICVLAPLLPLLL